MKSQNPYLDYFQKAKRAIALRIASVVIIFANVGLVIRFSDNVSHSVVQPDVGTGLYGGVSKSGKAGLASIRIFSDDLPIILSDCILHQVIRAPSLLHPFQRSDSDKLK